MVSDEAIKSPHPTPDSKQIASVEQRSNESVSVDGLADASNSSGENSEVKTSSIITPTQSNSLLKAPERKVFVPSSATNERKPTEAAGIVIKKDYLPSPTKAVKVEKTRDDVTRVLNYDTEPNPIRHLTNVNAATTTTATMTAADASGKSTDELIKVEKIETNIKTEPIDEVVPASKISDEKQPPKKPTQNSHMSENKENSIEKIDTPHKSKEHKPEIVLSNSIKTEASTEKKEQKSSSKSSHNHHHHHHHSSKTSSSNKSSSRRSSSSSTKECSRCYRRSKIKRVNVGVQCLKYGDTFKQMIPTSTPLKITKTPCNPSTDGLYSNLKYGKMFHIEVHTNGGASIVHMYQNEINSLSETEMDELTDEFFRVVFSEDENGFAHHVMGIVHDAAAYIPDLLEHMADNYSTLTVKAGVMGRNSDIETSTLAQYYEQVEKHYSHGTFRWGPLHQISLVGKVHEEVGGYFPDLLGRLENNPFLMKVIS